MHQNIQRGAALAGMRAIAPLVAGLIPLAFTVGATAARSGLPPLVGWVSSMTLYGASGQLTWMHLVHDGGPAALVVGATLMVNLQMVLYGTAMRAYWSTERRSWRLIASQLLVSPVFGVVSSHHSFEADPRRRRTFYMAAGLTLWIAWLLASGAGYAFGGLPSTPVLALLSPLVLLTLAVRAVRSAGAMTSLAVAATIAVVGRALPYDLGLVAAGMTGIACGIAVDRRRMVAER